MFFDTKNSIQSNNYSYEQYSVDKGAKVDEVTPATADKNNTSSEGSQQQLNPTTIRALEAANLPVNEKNIELVESMMREGMNIDKDSIQNMYRTLLKYPQLDSMVLISLKALDMEINDATIRQLESYTNQNHQITQGLQAVSDAMWQASLDLFETGTSQNMQSSLVLLGQMMQGMDVPAETLHFVKTAGELMALIDSTAGQENGNSQVAVTNGSGTVPEGMPNIEISGARVAQLCEVQNNNLLFMEKVQELMKNFIPAEDQTALEQQLAEINSNKGLLREMQKLECILLGIQNADEMSVENQNARSHDILLMNALGKGQESQFQTTSQGMLQSQLFVGNNVEKLVADIRTFLEAEGVNINKDMPNGLMDADKLGLLQEQIKDFVKQVLFDNKEFMWQLKDKFSQSILLNPEDVADPKKVMDLYDNLNQKLGQMAKILSDAGMAQSQTAQPLVQMQENVQFMNQLNQVFQYVQIPLRMFEKDVCGELCVYTNKKHMAQADGNLSAFLHLDMEYIGPVDVYVNLQKGNYVSTNFYLQDEGMLDFINEHIHMLDERLEQKGYKVSTKTSVREQEEETSVINHMLNHKSLDVKTKLLSVNSFDTLI